MKMQKTVKENQKVFNTFDFDLKFIYVLEDEEEQNSDGEEDDGETNNDAKLFKRKDFAHKKGFNNQSFARKRQRRN